MGWGLQGFLALSTSPSRGQEASSPLSVSVEVSSSVLTSSDIPMVLSSADREVFIKIRFLVALLDFRSF